MSKGLFAVCCMACCLLVSPVLGRAQDATPATGSAPAAPVAQPAAKPADSSRSDAAEARYRAWVEREHARDAAAFQQDKTKIEDKYKGYVRPKREKKGATSKSAKSEKDN